MQTRRLVLIRHASAEPYAATDQDRELTPKGRRAAVAAGAYLAAAGCRPDHVVVSEAVRTISTWQGVAHGAGSPVTATVDGALYTGNAEELLDALRAVPEQARDVVLVGHSPAVADLVHLLDDGNGDQQAVVRLLSGYPPAAFTVLELTGRWSGLAPGGGRILDVQVGAPPPR